MAVVAAVEDDCCLDTTMYVPAFAADANTAPASANAHVSASRRNEAWRIVPSSLTPVEGYL
jgi:hypothetical protein